MSFLTNIKDTISNALWPERNKFNSDSNAALDQKLKGLDWKEAEDAETNETLAKSSEAKDDSLAGTVFTARPQNPFSDDF